MNRTIEIPSQNLSLVHQNNMKSFQQSAWISYIRPYRQRIVTLILGWTLVISVTGFEI